MLAGEGCVDPCLDRQDGRHGCLTGEGGEGVLALLERSLTERGFRTRVPRRLCAVGPTLTERGFRTRVPRRLCAVGPTLAPAWERGWSHAVAMGVGILRRFAIGV